MVYALRLLKLAFDEYFTTVADYNRAEFELFHALGYPAKEITYFRPPGNVEPVDTDATALPPRCRQRTAPGNPLNARPLDWSPGQSAIAHSVRYNRFSREMSLQLNPWPSTQK